MFIIELVNHEDGMISKSEKGEADLVCRRLREWLFSLPENHGILINDYEEPADKSTKR